MKRKRKQKHNVRDIHLIFQRFYVCFFQLETPATSAETLEMGQTNQNVLRLLEDDEKVR
jgi:hypothetical protein